MAKIRPDELSGKTIRARTECGSLFLLLNPHEGELFEVDITLGKSGNCVRGLLNYIARDLSDKLQKEDKETVKKFILEHAVEVSCGCPFIHKGDNYKSCLDFVGKKIIEELEKEGG